MASARCMMSAHQAARIQPRLSSCACFSIVNRQHVNAELVRWSSHVLQSTRHTSFLLSCVIGSMRIKGSIAFGCNVGCRTTTRLSPDLDTLL